MILADKIINERKRNGWSQEELAEKLGVSRQSVSKWEGTQSIPDIQKILQMADLFGVSTDYLLKDELESKDASYSASDIETVSTVPLRTVSLEEANEFMEGESRRAPKIALGVSLCILSPVVLMLLATLSETGSKVTEQVAAGIGIIVLLGMVAAAVFIFLRAGHEREKYEYIETENIDTAYGVAGIVREKRESFRGKKNLLITIGVVMCIICPLPLITCAVLEMSELIIVGMVCVLLTIVSAAVNMFIRAGIVSDSYDMLLQENEYTVKEKESNKRIAPVGGIYWVAVTAVFLAISFVNDSWDRSWIIWPVAGVLFVVVMGIARMISDSRNK